MQSVHPPIASLTMEYGSNSQGEPYTFESTSYLILLEDKESSKIIKQNNFTNLNLHTISQQLSKVEKKVQQIKSEDKIEEIKSSKINIELVNIKPPIRVLKFNFRDNIQYNEFIKELQNKMKGLSINMLKNNMIKNKSSEYISDNGNIEGIKSIF